MSRVAVAWPAKAKARRLTDRGERSVAWVQYGGGVE